MANASSTASPPKLLHIDAIQTAMPRTVTPPGRSRRVSTTAPLGPGLLQSRFQIVLYYNRAGEEESPVTVGAWIKESLSAALSSHPVMAGRLRRDNEGSGYWEIKFNDCGVRLVQATAKMTMSEFLGSKEHRDGREEKLAYWVEVDKENPNFSPLFYIQVTQFQGDGYSIGISCSLLLADPLFLARFLKSWVETHTTMLAQGQLTKSSIFHLSYFQKPGCPRHLKSIELESNPLNSSSTATATAITTVLFKVARNDFGAQSYDALAATCLQKATRRLEAEAMPSYSLVISNHSGDVMIESHDKASLDSSSEIVDGAQEVAWLDQLGIQETTLTEGNKPVHVSCRVVSCIDGGLVLVMLPSDEEGVSELTISVTIQKI